MNQLKHMMNQAGTMSTPSNEILALKDRHAASSPDNHQRLEQQNAGGYNGYNSVNVPSPSGGQHYKSLTNGSRTIDDTVLMR